MIRRAMVLVMLAGLMLVPAVATAQQSPAASPSISGVQITPAPTVAGRPLVRTGTEVLPLVVVGVALAVAGVVLVLGARRRRTLAV